MTSMKRMAYLVCAGTLLLVSGTPAAENTWQRPLADKERTIEANIVARHNIWGLYPSVVELPSDGAPVDKTTATPYSNVAHSVVWTSNYLAGASFRYAALKKQGVPQAVAGTAQIRADELFDAVYRCLQVTGVRGLLARGYFLGHGPTYEERNDAQERDEWHQGTVDGRPLRWRGSPSHHIYSAAVYGIGQYYDLAAYGLQKQRAQSAIDELVSYWVDNNFKINHFDSSRPPVPVLGLTDGQTLDAPVLMAISEAKIAHHATGKEKFRKVYEQLIAQYHVRELKKFRTPKSFDDALHVFNHLEVLVRIEKDANLQEAYRRVADGLWRNHKQDGQSLFTYIYFGLRPNAADREAALDQAHQALFTWPTDMTIQPRMSSLDKKLKPPYPVYAARWDNEYIWKGDLLDGDGRFSRTVTNVAASTEDPQVLAAVDERGDLYMSLDGAASAAGWLPVETPVDAPVRSVEFGPRTRILVIATEKGFYSTASGGKRWRRLAVPDDGGKPVEIVFDPSSPWGLYAVTTHGVYRSRGFSESLLGENWESLTDGLSKDGEFRFELALGTPARIYARRGEQVFTAQVDDRLWHSAGRVGLGDLARGQQQPFNWLAIDPHQTARALFGVEIRPGAGPKRTLIQESTDAGNSWTNNADSVERLFADGKLVPLVFSLPPYSIRGITFDPHQAGRLYGIVDVGLIKSSDNGKTWSVKNSGFEIPVVRSVLAPRQTQWLFAGTPAGLFVSKDSGETWQSGHLVLQFDKNRRRELGGAEFIDAYWRARYYGFIDENRANSFVLSTDGSSAWQQIEPDGARQSAKPLVDAFVSAKFANLQVPLDLDPKDAAGVRRGDDQIIIVPIRDLRVDKNYPAVMTDPGNGMAIIFLPKRLRLFVDKKPVGADQVRQVNITTPSGSQQQVTALVVAARDRGPGEWYLYVYGTPPKPLIDTPINVDSAQKRLPIDLDVLDKEGGPTQIKVWMFGEHWAAFELEPAK